MRCRSTVRHNPHPAGRFAADELEVPVRTVYRDVATLQARRIPIEGAAGVGYVLRRRYESPLMFTEDEAEAIAVGLRLLAQSFSIPETVIARWLAERQDD
jgi:predicted DNA-binding transcriptional regulator YafY